MCAPNKICPSAHNKILNIYETVFSDQYCREVQAEVSSKWVVQQKRIHARRVHCDILAAGIRSRLPIAVLVDAGGWTSPWTRLARYTGHTWMECIMLHSLNWMWLWSRSQWSCFRAEVTWSRGLRFIMRRAATFWTHCSPTIIAISRLVRLELPITRSVEKLPEPYPW